METGKFVLKVLVLATVLCSVTWAGLRYTKNNNPGLYAKIEDCVENPGKYLTEIANWSKKNFGTADVHESPESQQPEAAIAHESEDEYSESDSAAPDVSEEKAEQVAADTNTKVEESVTNERIESLPPTEIDPLAALNGEPGYPWGIVVTNSFFYDSNMSKKGVLPGGTVVSCKRKDTHPSGYIYECHYLANRAWRPETVIIFEADLVVFNTTYRDANKEQRNLLIEYCKLYGRLEELRGAEIQALLNRNPYMNEYKKVAVEYQEFNNKVNAAMEEVKTAEGVKRSNLLDELRKQRYAQQELGARFKEISEKYTRWKEENVTPRMGSVTTPEMNEIQRLMNRLRPEVEKIVPGL
jgi:hypothetical protein